MGSPSRTSRFHKVLKVLKKYYQMVAPDPNRTVFEQLVFACCLENAHYDRAEEAFAALEHSFFDWNEIRVTTVRELSEVIGCLPEPPAAANRVKRVLQSIFESTYSFDLEELRKQNLGPAIAHLKKLDGTTPFSVAYVTQVALGGHAIPVDAGVLGAFAVLELITEDDVQSGTVPGLERAIAKSKGLEFASQLHQLGADFFADPSTPRLHDILLEINPDVRGRLPKRRARKQPDSLAALAERKAARKQARRGASAEAQQKTAEHEGDQAGAKQDSPEKKPRKRRKKATEEQAAPPAKKKPTKAKRGPTAKKQPEADEAESQGDAHTGKSTSAGLSKRKPR